MIIVCATDSNYAEYAGVLLRSIAVNGDVAEAQVFVLGDRLSQREKEWIVTSASGLDVRILDVDLTHNPRIKDLPSVFYWTRASYARLLLPEILPDVEGRVLFLDVDTIVNGSLRPLFDLDLGDNVFAAVPNPGDPDTLAHMNRIVGRDLDAKNYNAGVLLIDLGRWRDEQISERCFDFLALTPVVNFPDQDALNAVIGENVMTLDRTWNHWTMRSTNWKLADYSAGRIIHFTSGMKPNMVESRHPAKSLYLEHRAHTPWRDQPLRTRQPRGFRRLLADITQALYPELPQMRPATPRDIARAERKNRDA